MWDINLAIKTTIFLFPIISLLFSLPFLIIQYQKYGSSNWWRFITVYSFIFYLLVCYFTVVLPLPKRSAVSLMTSPFYDFEFGKFINIFFGQGLRTQGFEAWKEFFKSISFQQVFFNILMTVPFGVYLRYYFKRGWFTTLITSFALSCFFEITQITGLYGIYSRPYRLFDVDDLFLNTLGGMIGFIITPLLVFMFPSRDEMDLESISKSLNVGLLRRAVAFIIDLIQIGFVSLVAVYFIFPKAHLLKFLTSPKKLVKIILSRPELFILMVLIGCFIFIIIPYLTNGYTLGKKLVRLRLVGKDGDLKYWRLFLRYGYLAFVITVLYISAIQLLEYGLNLNQFLNASLSSVFILILVSLFTVVDTLIGIFTKSPFVYERLSQISNEAQEIPYTQWENED